MAGFGSKYVVFGGITSPASATATSASGDGGASVNRAPESTSHRSDELVDGGGRRHGLDLAGAAAGRLVQTVEHPGLQDRDVEAGDAAPAPVVGDLEPAPADVQAHRPTAAGDVRTGPAPGPRSPRTAGGAARRGRPGRGRRRWKESRRRPSIGLHDAEQAGVRGLAGRRPLLERGRGRGGGRRRCRSRRRPAPRRGRSVAGRPPAAATRSAGRRGADEVQQRLGLLHLLERARVRRPRAVQQLDQRGRPVSPWAWCHTRASTRCGCTASWPRTRPSATACTATSQTTPVYAVPSERLAVDVERDRGVGVRVGVDRDLVEVDARLVHASPTGRPPSCAPTPGGRRGRGTAGRCSRRGLASERGRR